MKFSIIALFVAVAAVSAQSGTGGGAAPTGNGTVLSTKPGPSATNGAGGSSGTGAGGAQSTSSGSGAAPTLLAGVGGVVGLVGGMMALL
ncbi:hypothetical protein BJ875DRAFT_487186 [Amylocarpus encephaloides]|uniref:Uncharacterized protein n=1 Tax=Amylocarpus encephaloides TaxID=45428 RepID=A0A9P8C2N0_9HELO|nr:hypothetical protein BJ875DRAFT_487186 [Amylocarpus encephaloides]